jgi:hypothetical protein
LAGRGITVYGHFTRFKQVAHHLFFQQLTMLQVHHVQLLLVSSMVMMIAGMVTVLLAPLLGQMLW